LQHKPKNIKNVSKRFIILRFPRVNIRRVYDLLWEDVSEKIVSTSYLDEYEDFISNLTFDMFRLYQMNNCLSIRLLSRMVESFFFHNFRFEPGTSNIEEIQDRHNS